MQRRIALMRTAPPPLSQLRRAQCLRMSLGGSKVVPPQRFSVVVSNAVSTVVQDAQSVLCRIKALRCSQPIKRNRLGVIPRKSSCTVTMQLAERVLAVSAAHP